MKQTILLTLLLACGTARASEWVSINKSNDGTTENLVDVSSIRVAGKIRRAWVKLAYAPYTHRGPADDASKWQKELVTRFAFDCVEETSKAEAVTAYYTDGTLWHAQAEDLGTAWEPIAPDTLQSAEIYFICAWKPK